MKRRWPALEVVFGLDHERRHFKTNLYVGGFMWLRPVPTGVPGSAA